MIPRCKTLAVGLLAALTLCASIGAAPATGAGTASASGAKAPFDVTCRLVAMALLEEDSTAAVDAFKAIIAADGRFAFDRINLGLALVKKLDYAGALTVLDEARKIDDGAAAYLIDQVANGLGRKLGSHRKAVPLRREYMERQTKQSDVAIADAHLPLSG